jgi:hypothetical protein
LCCRNRAVVPTLLLSTHWRGNSCGHSETHLRFAHQRWISLGDCGLPGCLIGFRGADAAVLRSDLGPILRVGGDETVCKATLRHGLFSRSAYLPSGLKVPTLRAKAHIHFGELMYGLKSIPFTH